MFRTSSSGVVGIYTTNNGHTMLFLNIWNRFQWGHNVFFTDGGQRAMVIPLYAVKIIVVTTHSLFSELSNFAWHQMLIVIGVLWTQLPYWCRRD